MNGREVRYLANAEIRSASKDRITGYAAVFNSLSEDLGGFRERIVPGAFRRAIQAKMDVRALINHDASKIIGRTAAGTLTVEEDSKGLAFSCKLPDTTYAQDLVKSINRGDISQCSFQFAKREDRWINDSNLGKVRELLDVDLFDICPVTFPAYPDTQVQARAKELGVTQLGIYRTNPAIDDEDDDWTRWAKGRIAKAYLDMPW